VRADCVARRLTAIPGVGPTGASAIVATLPDAHLFRSDRGFAAWLGLTPRQHNTAGKRRASGISKQGQRSLRTLLIVGASAQQRQERARGVKDPWLAGVLARRPVKVAAGARAAKTARIVWAMLARKEAYRAPLPQAARRRGRTQSEGASARDGKRSGNRDRDTPPRHRAASARRDDWLAWGPGPTSVVGPARRAIRASPQGQRSLHRAQRPDT
jgi:hypothetical protein